MLRLTRRQGQKIMIGDDITIEIGKTVNREVEVLIHAPRWVPVHREEIYKRIQAEKEAGL